MPVAVLLLAAVPLAWLLPNHYLPWLSAWQDGWALLLVAFAATFLNNSATLPRVWVAAAALIVANVLGQWAGGRIVFGGDALMVLVYLAGFVLAMALGSTLAARGAGRAGAAAKPGLQAWADAVVCCALASVGIALAQWTGSVSLGVYAADLPPGSRPFGNVAQPNHLCTICFLGLCSLGLLLQSGRVRKPVFGLAAIWFLWGMAMTASRTGWLQLAFLVVFMLALRRQTSKTLAPRQIGWLGATYVTFVLAWPRVNEMLLLDSSRTLADAAQAGTRLRHWQAMLDAIGSAPMWGYGWAQVGAAQLAVADRHPYTGEHIEHSHNILLDLLLWNGIPIGALLSAIVLWWLLSRLWRCQSSPAAWLLVGIAGIFIHGLLEFPLEYAYFLLPLGVAIGAVEVLVPGGRSLALGRWPLRAAGLGLIAVLGIVGADYLEAEQSMRVLRMESAHIGVRQITTPPPKLKVLGQLEAFQAFAQTEARPGMTTTEMASMQRVLTRYAYPSLMFRYALALGLNGRPDASAQILKKLCRMHPVERCREAREGWASLQVKFPVLTAIAVPDLPDTSLADNLLHPQPKP